VQEKPKLEKKVVGKLKGLFMMANKTQTVKQEPILSAPK
jgi:hypothetical protein